MSPGDSWIHRGRRRPSFASVPGPGQESVWDYPRPPRIEADARLVEVKSARRVLARTQRALRILETASPPTFYVPPDDVDTSALVPASGRTVCEWKGEAHYWALRDMTGSRPVAWSYPAPSPAFTAITGYLAFYPGRVDCFVAGERVRAQPGDFYGGWITAEVVGPFKGEPGTVGW